MKEIPLTKGKVAFVDVVDYDYLSQWKWYYGAKGYAVRTDYSGEKPQTILMHRIILQRCGFEFIQVDHRNHNTLDNRRKNLRPATKSDQQHNTRKRSDNTSGLKGVTKHKQTGKWRARIMIRGKQKYLGSFRDKHEAAEVYEKAAKQYFGEFACLGECI